MKKYLRYLSLSIFMIFGTFGSISQIQDNSNMMIKYDIDSENVSEIEPPTLTKFEAYESDEDNSLTFIWDFSLNDSEQLDSIYIVDYSNRINEDITTYTIQDKTYYHGFFEMKNLSYGYKYNFSLIVNYQYAESDTLIFQYQHSLTGGNVVNSAGQIPFYPIYFSKTYFFLSFSIIIFLVSWIVLEVIWYKKHSKVY